MSRARPELKPRIISCRECGAPTELRDERTLMLICQHCGAQLDLSEVEQRVLERGASRGIAYRLNLGERLSLRGGTYEIIARVCLIEDGDVEDQTHQYYLYSPTRRPLWLSDYRGKFDLTWRTRVRPQGDIFGPAPYFTTYDGRSWKRLEVGVAEVYDVDGALPYVQRRGDVIEYADLSLVAQPGTLYEANRSQDEIEYGEGQSLSIGGVENALGRRLSLAHARGGSSSSQIGCAPAIVVVVTTVFVALLLLVLSGNGGGQRVAHQVLLAGQEAENIVGPSFFVHNENSVVRVRLQAPLRNAWMYAQVALVQADGDTVVHVDETELSYYEGYEGGVLWTEGHTSTDIFVAVEEPGPYRLMLGGVSGHGESPSPAMSHSLTAEVFVDATYRQAATYGACAAFSFGLLAFFVVVAAGLLFSKRKRAVWFLVVAHGAVQLALVALSLIGSANGWGAPELEHPDGISIRQSSVSGRPGLPFFVIYNAPRSHLGGGVHAGK